MARLGYHRAGALLTAGLALLLIVDRDTATALVSGLAVVAGVGIGLIMQSSLLVTMNSAEPRDMGATGTPTLLRTVGGSLGISFLGALFTARLETGLADRLGPSVAERLTGREPLTPAFVRAMPATIREAFAAATASGLRGVVLGATALGVATIATAVLVREVPLRTREAHPEPKPELVGTGRE